MQKTTVRYSTPVDADIAGFVWYTMLDFARYIPNNNLDPSPPDSSIYTIQGSNLVINLTSELSNLTYEGFANSMEFVKSSVDYINGRFNVTLTFYTSFKGTHKTNWSVRRQPIYSEGTWSTRSLFRLYKSYVIDIGLVSPNYLSVTQVKGEPLDFATPVFENVTNNEALQGYEEFFSRLIVKEYDRFLDDLVDPLALILKQFWKEEFAEYTFEDIVGSGATQPPDWTTIYNKATTQVPFQFI